MSDTSGSIGSLVALSPLLGDTSLDVGHAAALRSHLSTTPQDQNSPFAKIGTTHLARLAILDDVPFVGAPTREEHLRSRYLLFEANFDGELDAYLQRMTNEIPDFIHSVWSHCVGYPTVGPTAFAPYLKKCRIRTAFLFAGLDCRTVEQNLRALRVQAGVARFVERNQGRSPSEIKEAFQSFVRAMRDAPTPIGGEFEFRAESGATAS